MIYKQSVMYIHGALQIKASRLQLPSVGVGGISA